MTFKSTLRRLFSTIRKRVLFFSLGTVVLLGLVSYYSQWNAQWMLWGVWQVNERQKAFLDLGQAVDDIGVSLESYLTFKGSESLLKFIRRSSDLEFGLNRLAEVPVENPLSRGSIRNLIGLGREFLLEANKTVSYKRGRNEEAYSRSFEMVQKITAYWNDELDRLSLQEYRSSLKQASVLYQQLGFLQLTNSLMLGALLLLAILLSFWFAQNLSDPLEKLSIAASEIARGNYDFDLPATDSEETGKLTHAFHQMRLSIIRNIDNIRLKAEVETENLRMKSLLKNAEFQALQAQINPHFLFNTLNAASQLAMMEDALETERFLNRLALLMRHNIRKLDQPISLSEELHSLENYIYIVHIRFGSRIRIEVKIDAEIAGVTIPPMTIQPLVENSILHGLKDREDGGLIVVRVIQDPRKSISIVVSDNGEGMEPSIVQRYLDDSWGDYSASKDESATGQSTGIGLGNVIHRMRLFFASKDVVEIDSTRGLGTRVVLKIPLRGEEKL